LTVTQLVPGSNPGCGAKQLKGVYVILGLSFNARL
jgi:hypothetical protein